MTRIPYKGGEVDATDVDFQIRKEDWNEYLLMDGTVLKMKLVIGDVFKVPGEFDNEGNPVYIVKSNNILVVRAPDNLKRK